MFLPPRDPSCPYQVNVIFKVTLHVTDQADFDKVNTWFNAVFTASLAKCYAGVAVETTYNGPCWAAYIEITGPRLSRVKALADRAVNLARTKRVPLET